MNEMIQAAQDRQMQLDQRIAQREAEISDLRAESEKLTTLIGLAKELFVSGDAPQAEAPATAHAPQPQAAIQKPQAVAPDTVQHPKQPERPQIMPARQPRSA